MDEEHGWRTFALVPARRSYLEALNFESAFEHDYKLSKTRYLSPPINNTQEIIKPDRKIAKCNNEMESHPNLNHLDNSSEKSTLSARRNKVLIYERTTSFRVKEKWRKGGQSFREDYTEYYGAIQTMLIITGLRIDPRKRWSKLYDRTYSFRGIRQSLSAEITQFQNLLPVKESAERRSAVGQFWRNERVSRILIYCRCQLELRDDGRCFHMVWNEPCLSGIDEESGQTLSHITLLCRDVICECNKCTTDCPNPRWRFSCEVCTIKDVGERTNTLLTIQSGSCAEDCMLPIFYVHNNENDVVEKMSDIDFMAHYRGYAVGFDEKECNVVATIETKNSPPGYLQLKGIGTGKQFCMPYIDFFGHHNPYKQSSILSWYCGILHSSRHGPSYNISR